MATRLIVYGTRQEEIKVWPFTRYEGFSFLQVERIVDVLR